MTQEESLQNLETVKKMAHLYSDDCVYLKFKNNFDFEVVRLSSLDNDYHASILDIHYGSNLPYGHLWVPPLCNEPHLRYKDKNLNFLLNLTTQEYTLTYADAPADLEEVRQEYLDLIGKFK